ncbi:MAG: RidA family protein, partial [Candidatus Bathyarchaeia archaeon]
MGREVIIPKNIVSSKAPYSPAIKLGNLVFTAGQVSQDFGTGKPVEGDIAIQTRQTLENIKTVLAAAGTSLDNVIKVTVFLTNMADYDKMNEIYRTYFATNPPARSTVQVAKLV